MTPAFSDLPSASRGRKGRRSSSVVNRRSGKSPCVSSCQLFARASKALDDARTADALAATRLAKATDAWNRLMEKTYGAMVTEETRASAERYFPKVNRKVATKKENEEKKPEPKPA